MARKTVQHKYFDEKLWEQVSKENKNLLRDFLEYMKSADKSPQSIKTYTNAIQIFFIWNFQNNDNKFFVDLTKKDVMRFQNYLVHEKSLSPSRVRLIRSSLSSMGNYIMNFEDELYPNYINLINRISAPPLEQVRQKTYLTEEQVEELLTKLEEQCRWQQALYVAISFASGARKSEIRQFKVSDFSPERLKNDLYITSPIRCKGRGKIGKIRQIKVFAGIIQKWLDKWLQIREESGIESEYLFVTKDKNGQYNQVNNNTFNKWCERFTKILGVDVFPHAFRSSIASHLKNTKKKDITSICKLLGHKDISTTQIYIESKEEEEIEDLFS